MSIRYLMTRLLISISNIVTYHVLVDDTSKQVLIMGYTFATSHLIATVLQQVNLLSLIASCQVEPLHMLSIQHDQLITFPFNRLDLAVISAKAVHHVQVKPVIHARMSQPDRVTVTLIVQWVRSIQMLLLQHLHVEQPEQVFATFISR